MTKQFIKKFDEFHAGKQFESAGQSGETIETLIMEEMKNEEVATSAIFAGLAAAAIIPYVAKMLGDNVDAAKKLVERKPKEAMALFKKAMQKKSTAPVAGSEY